MKNTSRAKHLYSPKAAEPYRLSRSKLELFIECPRCFYLDRCLGIARPDGPPFSLNLAVDALMKREFDTHRAQGKPHPLMMTYGVDAVPFQDPRMEEWRDYKRGVAALHRPSNFLFFGAVDDIWQATDGSLLVVDYKATSTAAEITLDHAYRDGYKRQIECYQWLLRRSGFTVSDTGYFVFVNADRDREAFDRRLEFSVHLLPYIGNDKWVEDALVEAHRVLQDDVPPPSTENCEWCGYRREARGVEG